MISFEDWYEYYEPLVEYIYYEFISISYTNGIEIDNNEYAFNDFAYILYNTSKNQRLVPAELWPFDIYKCEEYNESEEYNNDLDNY